MPDLPAGGLVSPLDGTIAPGTHGRTGAAGPGVLITERHGLSIVQLVPLRGHAESVAAGMRDRLGLELPVAPNTGAVAREPEDDPIAALWIGPGQWFVVCAGLAEGALECMLRELIPDRAAIFDQSHGRLVLRLSGPAAREVLARGCRVDFHARALPPGACAQTAIGAIATLVYAIDATPTYDLYLPRGYALAFWEWLTHSAAPLGYRVCS